MTKEEQKEMLKEINMCGYNFKTLNDVKKIGKKDKILIPILLKWLKNSKDLQDKSWIARYLTVKGYTEATEELLKLYMEMDEYGKGDRWAVGNAIGVIADERYIEEYIKIALDKKNGNSRQMIVYEMGSYKDNEKIKRTLLKLLKDEEVNGHALHALSKFKDKKLIKKLEPFLEHKMTWKRNEAKKTIKKLEKLKD